MSTATGVLISNLNCLSFPGNYTQLYTHQVASQGEKDLSVSLNAKHVFVLFLFLFFSQQYVDETETINCLVVIGGGEGSRSQSAGEASDGCEQ